ncbi:unnamed protein product [Strongylus vulgaris]|uniref:Uncharacterized protein n=1 Tax=Strongylus vulgaris TaxID=40348 RepID=A0A3P7ISW9_STRVU|nr:unnamed protein product [Strongylus vulgaris]
MLAVYGHAMLGKQHVFGRNQRSEIGRTRAEAAGRLKGGTLRRRHGSSSDGDEHRHYVRLRPGTATKCYKTMPTDGVPSAQFAAPRVHVPSLGAASAQSAQSLDECQIIEHIFSDLQSGSVLQGESGNTELEGRKKAYKNNLLSCQEYKLAGNTKIKIEDFLSVWSRSQN